MKINPPPLAGKLLKFVKKEYKIIPINPRDTRRMEKFFDLFKKNLKTLRLELRLLEPSAENAELIWNTLKAENRGDFAFINYSPKYDKPLPESVDDVLEIMKNDDKMAADNGVVWYIFHNNNLVGYQRIHYWPQSKTIQFAAVWFVKSAWGHGFSQEVHNTLEQISFEQLKVHRVTRQCMAGNLHSKKSIENAGYHLDGCVRDSHLMPDGTWMDHLTYTKLESEYKD